MLRFLEAVKSHKTKHHGILRYILQVSEWYVSIIFNKINFYHLHEGLSRKE